MLSAVLLAAAAGDAAAVALNPEGIGQVLLYPYFTVNAGNQTLLSVVNTQNVGKVVKVRFREGYDGHDILDFNLYLSPYDVWTATVFDTAGLAGHASGPGAEGALLTPDNSCTDPAIKSGTVGVTEILPDGRNFVSFVNYAYTGQQADGGPVDLARTRTGHIDLIEMADVVGDTLQAITHVNGVPRTCGAVIGAQPGPDYVSPSGGLFGSASIINVQSGTLYGTNAEALSGFYTASGNLFSAAGSIKPDLGSGDNSDISPGNAVSYVLGDDGTPIRSSWPLAGGGSFDAVSSLFVASVVFNEFELNPGTGAVTSEWVTTFPTKSYYVDPTLVEPVLEPFTTVFGQDAATRPGTACETIGLNFYNREEGVPPSLTIIEPPPPGLVPPALCWESQAVSFAPSSSVGATSPVFATPIFLALDPLHALGATGTSGMLAMTLAGNFHTMRTSNEGHVFVGLPMIGFLAKDFTNKNVTPGILGNYSGTYRHHSLHACIDSDASCH